MKRIMLMAILCFYVGTLRGAEKEKTYERTIHVFGEGEINVAPDEAQFGFQIQSFGAKIKDVQKQNASKTNELMETLKKLGIPAKDVQTSHVRIEPQYDFSSGKRKFREYAAFKGFTIKLRELENYGAVMNGLIDAGVEQAGGLTYGSSRVKQLSEDARKAAVLDAKAKAESMAGPLGVTVGRVIKIEEETSSEPVMPMRAMAMGMMADKAAAPDALSTGEIQIKTKVYVQFELN